MTAGIRKRRSADTVLEYRGTACRLRVSAGRQLRGAGAWMIRIFRVDQRGPGETKKQAKRVWQRGLAPRRFIRFYMCGLFLHSVVRRTESSRSCDGLGHAHRGKKLRGLAFPERATTHVVCRNSYWVLLYRTRL